MIVRIAIEKIFDIQKQREEINRILLREIIWTKGGNPITPDRKKIDAWELTGLTNMDFVLSGEVERQNER
jgi:hypothetical protein